MEKSSMLCALLCIVLTSVVGFCPDLEGNTVSWWILYQQKERPFFHYYVDSASTTRVKEHYPEKVDSVLSRVISTITESDDAEYIVYSSDLINARHIAEERGIPSYSKWMHGILGTTTSWNSGFWLLHNNLLFPATKNGTIAAPGSKSWTLTTIGDNMANLFYACLTAENKDSMEDTLLSIMAGNPFIFKKQLSSNFFIQTYLREIRPLATSFSYQYSAMIYLNCVYASRNNISQQCLFRYSAKVGMSINVFTRPRGLFKHDSHFCYNEETTSLYDFVKIDETTSGSDWTNSIFALTDQPDSGLSGTTCFGQDIAANTETVAIMICINIPNMYKTMLKSSRVSQWSCTPTKKRQVPTTTSTMIKFPKVKDNHVFNPVPTTKESSSEEIGEALHEAVDDPNEKGPAKFCLVNNCNINDNDGDEGGDESTDLKNPLLKNEKLSEWFYEMMSDIKVQEHINSSLKTNKKKKREKMPIKVQKESDVEKFLTNNQNSVLGLFCREGCTYCTNAKAEITLLSESLQIDSIDIVLVDVYKVDLPTYLQVEWTPHIRYKKHGQTAIWIDYTDEEIDMMHMLKFLNEVIAKGRTSNDVNSNAVDENHLKEYGYITDANNRKRRDTLSISMYIPGNGDLKRPFHLGNSRRTKRSVSDTFRLKHIWKIAEVDITAEKAFLQLDMSKKNPELHAILRKHSSQKTINVLLNRTINTFIVPLNEMAIANLEKTVDQIYKENKTTYDMMLVGNKQINLPEIDIQKLPVLLVHVENGRCGIKRNGYITVGIKKIKNEISIVHFDSKLKISDLAFDDCPKEKTPNIGLKCRFKETLKSLVRRLFRL